MLRVSSINFTLSDVIWCDIFACAPLRNFEGEDKSRIIIHLVCHGDLKFDLASLSCSSFGFCDSYLSKGDNAYLKMKENYGWNR